MMPNPKVGTVTFDVGKAVSELKGGKVEFRVEKAGIVHVPVGRVSFGPEKLAENFKSLMESYYPLETLCVQRCLSKRCFYFHHHGAGTEAGSSGDQKSS